MPRLVIVSGSKVIASFVMPLNTVGAVEKYLTFSKALDLKQDFLNFAGPIQTRVTETLPM